MRAVVVLHSKIKWRHTVGKDFFTLMKPKRKSSCSRWSRKVLKMLWRLTIVLKQKPEGKIDTDCERKKKRLILIVVIIEIPFYTYFFFFEGGHILSTIVLVSTVSCDPSRVESINSKRHGEVNGGSSLGRGNSIKILAWLLLRKLDSSEHFSSYPQLLLCSHRNVILIPTNN